MSFTAEARSHPRRWAVVGILVVAAVASCAPDAAPGSQPTPQGQLSVRSGSTTLASAASCPTGLVPAKVFPPERSNVRLRVMNASGRAGLETAIANEFRDRGLQVVGTGTEPERYDGEVILRYGPQAVGAAWDVKPFFLIGFGIAGPWKDDFQLARTDDIVDVVLGTLFTNLATTTEVNQATAKLELPTAPPGTCALPHP